MWEISNCMLRYRQRYTNAHTKKFQNSNLFLFCNLNPKLQFLPTVRLESGICLWPLPLAEPPAISLGSLLYSACFTQAEGLQCFHRPRKLKAKLCFQGMLKYLPGHSHTSPLDSWGGEGRHTMHLTSCLLYPQRYMFFMRQTKSFSWSN